MKLDEQITAWLSDIKPTVTASTVQSYQLRLGTFAEWLGSRPPSKPVVAQWFNCLRSTLSARTVLIYRQTLCGFFNWCVEQGVVKTNPVGKVRNLTPGPTDRSVFTTEQYHAVRCLAQAEQSYWATAIVIGYHTGLRLSDVALMKWTQVNFGAESITVTPLKTKRLGKTVEIPMSKELFKCLAEQRLAYDEVEYVSRPMATHYLFDQHKTLSMQFHRLVGRAGVTGVSFHSLRHGFVTRLLENGVSAELISTMTAQTVDQVMAYSHVGLAAKRKAMGI